MFPCILWGGVNQWVPHDHSVWGAITRSYIQIWSTLRRIQPCWLQHAAKLWAGSWVSLHSEPLSRAEGREEGRNSKDRYKDRNYENILKSRNNNLRWGSSISIVAGIRVGKPGFDSRQRQWREFFLITAYRSVLRPTQNSNQWIRGGGGGGGRLSLGAKRTRREADISPPSSAELNRMRLPC
jgi:hypothetical protein